MLNKLSLFYSRIFSISKTTTSEKTNDLVVQDKYSIILSRNINNNKTHIDILYNVDTKNSESIIKNAENLAEMIVYLGSNSFQKTILNKLLNQYNQAEEIGEKIFIDNIIAFYEVIRNETSSINKSKSPVIRPLGVFNTK
jgi:enoyl reductase-like protein